MPGMWSGSEELLEGYLEFSAPNPQAPNPGASFAKALLGLDFGPSPENDKLGIGATDRTNHRVLTISLLTVYYRTEFLPLTG